MSNPFYVDDHELPIEADRPIVCFDLEATGKDPTEARIIQIAAQVFGPDGEKTSEYDTLVNPPVRIPDHVRELTGISHNDVKDAPRFKDIANDVVALFMGKHLIGYNSKAYDMPLLKAELHRHDLVFPNGEDRIHLDIFRKEKDLQSRSLGDVFHKYTGEDLEGGHDAHVDVKGTIEILVGQIDHYGLSGGISSLALDEDDYLDNKQRLKRGDNGELLVCFGKHADDGPISFQDLIQKDRGYALWIWEEIEELRPYIREHCEQFMS